MIITAISGKGNPLLPPYSKKIVILENDEIIRDEDLILFGSNPTDWWSWVKLDKSLVGEKFSKVFLNEKNIHGRILEEN